MGSEGSRALTITVEQGSLLDVDTQVIVNAANSYGLMGGGVAGVIRRVAGFQVEEEARKQAPIPVGMADTRPIAYAPWRTANSASVIDLMQQILTQTKECFRPTDRR